MFVLSQKYTTQGNLIKSELCYPSSLSYYQNSDDADAMIKFMEKEQHNDLEKLLLARYSLKLDNINHIKATRLLYEYRFEEALAYFEKINLEDYLYADPFTMRLIDCHDCDFSATQNEKYTRYSFVKKMIALKQSFETEKSKETLSKNLFMYANALYNMTYFGNGRFIASTPISWINNYHIKEQAKTHQYYYDCTEALTYYNKALSITSNKEFAAQCTWAAAKCEHNLKLMGYMPWQTQASVDFEAGAYFLEMKTKYAGTKYYKEVLNECGYFCSYITNDTTCIRDKWSWRNR
jgi:tetratricopeptide (TPR) repeat protein